MFWYVSNEQDQVVMKKPLLENTAILLWETAGCKLGGIRGACASASLKLDGHQGFCPGPNRYPRRMRLGLIEAGVAKPALLGGKRYPRRMRLGLIEAGSAARSMAAVSWVSEAHAPRPH